MSDPTARQIAEQVVRDHETSCDGNLYPEADYCCIVIDKPLCAGCSTLADSITRAITEHVATLTADLAQARQEHNAAVDRQMLALDALAEAQQERDAALSPHVMAGLLAYLKGECEAQHARADAAQQARDAAQDQVRQLKDTVSTQGMELSLARQARDAAHEQIADLQDILNQRQARLEAAEQARDAAHNRAIVAEESLRMMTENAKSLQLHAKSAARTSLLEAAEAMEQADNRELLVVGAAWLRSRAGEAK